MKLLVFGLSLSSSWGNGHATTYRALLRAFNERGHEVTFIEWDAPWYRGDHRDHPAPDYAELVLYSDWGAIRARALAEARDADAVIVGSYVNGGTAIIDELLERGSAPLLFYDIDTPVTVAALRRGGAEYLRRDQIPFLEHYLSFTGGPFLEEVLMKEFGARAASPLYCSVDASRYRPVPPAPRFAVDLAYMGTYAEDRQPVVEEFLLEVARRLPERRFLVAGPQYPPELEWPENVVHISHLPPSQHASFYSSADWQLNATRADMVRAGWSPSVRLFEAGAAGAAIISDRWPGIDRFFTPGTEIVLPEAAEEIVELLEETRIEERRAIGEAMIMRILSEHTAAHRARELEDYLLAATRPPRVDPLRSIPS